MSLTELKMQVLSLTDISLETLVEKYGNGVTVPQVEPKKRKKKQRRKNKKIKKALDDEETTQTQLYNSEKQPADDKGESETGELELTEDEQQRLDDQIVADFRKKLDDLAHDIPYSQVSFN